MPERNQQTKNKKLMYQSRDSAMQRKPKSEIEKRCHVHGIVDLLTCFYRDRLEHDFVVFRNRVFKEMTHETTTASATSRKKMKEPLKEEKAYQHETDAQDRKTKRRTKGLTADQLNSSELLKDKNATEFLISDTSGGRKEYRITN